MRRTKALPQNKQGFLLALIFLLLASVATNNFNTSVVAGNVYYSGDWVVNDPTIKNNENITINGNIIVNNTLRLENSIIWFEGNKSFINVTEHGALILRNTTIRGYSEDIRWSLSVYNGGECNIDNSTLINVGYEGYDYQSGVWINSKSVTINNSVIIDGYIPIWISSAENITIQNTGITSAKSSSNMGIRISQSNDIFVENTTIDSKYFNTGLRIENSENISVTRSSISINSNGFAFYAINSQNVSIEETTIINNYNVGAQGFAAYLNNVENVEILNSTLESNWHAFFLFTTVENIIVKNSNITSLNGETIYARGNNFSGLSFSNSFLNAKIVIIDAESLIDSVFSNNKIENTVTRYVKLEQSYNLTFVGNVLSNAVYGPYIVGSANISFVNEKMTTSDVGFNIINSTNINIQSGDFSTMEFLYASNTTNTQLIGNKIITTDYSVFVKDGTSILFANNTVQSKNGDVLILNRVTNTHIEQNNVTAYQNAVLIYNSANVTFNSNNFLMNGSVHVENSTFLLMNNNLLFGNLTATEFYNVSNSVLQGNTFTSVTSYGLLLSRKSDNNTIKQNYFVSSGNVGLYLHNGTNNLIYENSFLWNNNNNSQADDKQPGNHWDNGTIGNLYCNYDGIDSNNDGIGDTPFQISANATDNKPIVVDNDNDGLNDPSEIIVFHTNPLVNDSDNDGLNDGEELFVYNTSPVNNDTDGDGMPDGWEVTNNLDPKTNDSLSDPDNDGLTNLQEYQYGTDPHNNDTDGDGMPDGWEAINSLNPTANDASQDPDNDGLTNLQEYQHNTNPRNNDTDSDGMPDGWEVTNDLDPTTDDASQDPDNDGLTSLQEYQHNTDPNNKDTDGDGLTDSEEINKYHTDPLKADTDGDGLKDGTEVQKGLDPLNKDTDGDGVIDSEDMLPKINNNYLYAGTGLTIIIIAGITFYLVKYKKIKIGKKT